MPLTLDHPVHDLDPAIPTYDEGAVLRKHGPIVPVQLAEGVRAWATTTYDATRTVLESHPHLSKDPAHWGAYRRGEIPAGFPLLPFIVGETMLTKDGADHLRLRRLVARAFTPKHIATLAPRVERLAGELLDGLDTGSVLDLKEQYAFPLPMRIISEFFGVTDPERQQVLRGHYATLLSADATGEQRQAAALGLGDELTRLIEDKRRHPGDDLTSTLAAIDDGDRLSEQELRDTLQLILVAGHETTVNAITTTIHALLTHPDQLALVRGGRHDWSAAFEAALAWNGPFRNVYMRYATADTEIAGTRVREGEPIFVLLAFSDREAAERYDVTRPPKGHLAFGAGPHFCIGAPLARLEGAVAVGKLFTRFPDLRLAVAENELTPLISPAINGLTTLPVRLG
ncbi:cytochrome P450 [Amycolatopsis sp. FDAARGOS 1241]|uniref:cytochrome P450 family protein n=1 Tax=Amycolatopsis sp. FDAARGOS 1241 TaxID=2778070 RepID=UPI00194FAC2B|nr:cytochrome P450 [Amycolatopsis sp. FDAARGOS 1241]QRP43164.1 cytochrome P450 [Amycolatopsis sp. FDAARGOS 1241]